MTDRLTKFNEETGEYEYKERAKTQEEFNAQRKAVIQRLGEFEDKASDVAEEIFAEIDDFQRTLRHIFLDMCGGNDYNTLNLLQIDSAIEALFDSRIAELKKKYTVTDTNVGCKTEEGK